MTSFIRPSLSSLVALTFLALVSLYVFTVSAAAAATTTLGQAALNTFGHTSSESEGEGDSFTGQATALLFAGSAVPVAADILARLVQKHLPLSERLKMLIRRINAMQKKYLMQFHTYLSILALGLGISHLMLSSCESNPWPEIALILSGILVCTGLLFKWKNLPAFLRKNLYRFHTNIMVSGILLIIVYTGHSIMDLD